MHCQVYRTYGRDSSDISTIADDVCAIASSYTSADVSTDSSTNAGHLTTTHQRIH